MPCVSSQNPPRLEEVIDHGQGIKVADEEKLFEPFYTTRLERNASGLGLTVARRFLRLRGGNLELKSRGSPTCFEIKLIKLTENRVWLYLFCGALLFSSECSNGSLSSNNPLKLPDKLLL